MNRAEQRRQTEETILATARRMFAELGYDRTTIRAVAKAAGVDPGLVMHYFGSKDDLFARAAEASAEPLAADGPRGLAEALLASLATRLDSEPAASLAVLRSMLTNPGAADRLRAAAEPQLGQIAGAIPTADAGLRAALLSAIVHGVLIERYLLRLGGLEDSSPAAIIDLLRPCFEALAAVPPTGSSDRP